MTFEKLVLRGSSVRPLFVTAAGMPAAGAADLVRCMAGGRQVPRKTGGRFSAKALRPSR